LPPPCADYLKIWGSQPPGPLRTCAGLQWDCFILLSYSHYRNCFIDNTALRFIAPCLKNSEHTMTCFISFLNAIFFWGFSNKLPSHYNYLSTPIILQWLPNPFSNICKLCGSISIILSQSVSAKQSRNLFISTDAVLKDNNLQTLCHAILLHILKIICVALDGTHVVKSNLLMCLIKHRLLKARK
jgi:hypothetical protein